MRTHHLYVGFLVKGLSENRYNKDVDEERDEESDGRLDEEILIGFLYVLLVVAVDLARLEENGNFRKSKTQQAD